MRMESGSRRNPVSRRSRSGLVGGPCAPGPCAPGPCAPRAVRAAGRARRGPCAPRAVRAAGRARRGPCAPKPCAPQACVDRRPKSPGRKPGDSAWKRSPASMRNCKRNRAPPGVPSLPLRGCWGAVRAAGVRAGAVRAAAVRAAAVRAAAVRAAGRARRGPCAPGPCAPGPCAERCPKSPGRKPGDSAWKRSPARYRRP
jgi:hypothetical protein